MFLHIVPEAAGRDELSVNKLNQWFLPTMSGKIHLAQTHNEAGIKYDTGKNRNGPMEFGAGLFVQAG